MLPLAFLYATIGVFISMWIFPNNAGLTMVFFTVMATLPLMVHLIRYEEKKLFIRPLAEEHHKKIMPFFVFMFLGMVLAYSFWFIAFPSSLVSNLFNIQLNTIIQINSKIVGDFVGDYLVAVLMNNIKVLAFCMLFSFIYGAGAIFILTWNASVISVAIGNTARNILSSVAGTAGAIGATHYFHAFSLGLLKYMIHGIPEIGAYFVGGLAGGMISVAVIKHDFLDMKFRKVLIDSSSLICLAIGLLFLAGLLETFISPLVPV